MSETSLPPCGPERDRLVAQAVGWAYPEQHRKVVVSDRVWPDTGEAQWHYEGDDKPIALEWRCPSSSDADALAALEAWKEQEIGRHVTVDIGHCVHVCLYEPDRFSAFGQAPTLAGAATAALVRWRNERSAT